MTSKKRNPLGVGPKFPQVVVLVGATGDLSKRKLLPGLFHLANSGFIPGCRIVGVSLDEMDVEAFRILTRGALDEFSSRKVSEEDWVAFSETLDYVPISRGAAALKQAVAKAEKSIGGECRHVHYLSVPPKAALSAVRLLAEAGLVAKCRVIMEKPFGTDLASAVDLNAQLHEIFTKNRFFALITFSARSRRRIFWHSVSPTACLNRSGTATSSIMYRSMFRRHWGLASVSGSMKPPAHSATWW